MFLPSDKSSTWSPDRIERRLAQGDVGDVVARMIYLLCRDGVLPEDVSGDFGSPVAHTMFDGGYDHLWDELMALRRYIVTGDEKLMEATYATDTTFSDDPEMLALMDELAQAKFDILDETVASLDRQAPASIEQALSIRELLGNLPTEVMFRFKAGQLTVGNVAALYRCFSEAVDHLGVIYDDLPTVEDKGGRDCRAAG